MTKARETADYSEVKQWGLDETSSKKWHNYVTSFVDLKTKKICFITPWKWKDTLKSIKEDLENHKCNTDKIDALTMDLSPSFIAWAKAYFPKASIVFDKYHVMQIMWKALDEVRKKEVQQNETLKRTKYLWLTWKENLKKDKEEKLKKLMQENEVLWKTYQFKENLRSFWDIEDYNQAEEYLDLRCESAVNEKIWPLIKVVKSIKKHKYWIMEYIKRRITNGILEWLNSVIQTIKRVWRWFKNINNFITMIYLRLWNFDVIWPN